MPRFRRCVSEWVTLMAAILVIGGAVAAVAGGQGVPMEPDENGVFEYSDDFTTPRFLLDVVHDLPPPENWESGHVLNRGPGTTTLTYRFHGDRAIKAVKIEANQRGNNALLGGYNLMHVGVNGLDWIPAGDGRKLEADSNNWESGVLTLPNEAEQQLLGATELWIRVEMRNRSGLKTAPSNFLSQLDVRVELGDEVEAADAQAALRARWGELRRDSGWSSISLDPADGENAAPHYYEDSDGWLMARDDDPVLVADETDGFPVHRAYINEYVQKWPLALGAFVKTAGATGPLMARITVDGGPDTCRNLRILWNGEEIASLDTAQGTTAGRTFYVETPGAPADAVHELRIAGGDWDPVLIKGVVIAGPSDIAWTEKPAMPAGGSIEVLSAYYMPDPKGPPDSQAVEGRHDKKKVGLIFKPMQRLYEEHADFGGVGGVVRNNSDVPVRIDRPVLLNGKPVSASFVDWTDSAWDARGVVWYRVRPRWLEPGDCSQAYIRFRRRPEGESAKVTIPLVAGKGVEAEIPYQDPGAFIDYVTTDEKRQKLYVYLRRSPGKDPGTPTGLRLNGKPLKKVKVYGDDFPGEVALLVAKLKQPLESMSYNIVGVDREGGDPIDAQFRVLHWFFPRTSIHIPPQLCAEMNMNMRMWTDPGFEECDQYDIVTATGEEQLWNVHDRTWYIMGVDEPDAHDGKYARDIGLESNERYARALGFQARRKTLGEWTTLTYRFAPKAAPWIVVNGTTRPLNWGVYGQVADISCYDPYPVTYFRADHAFVRESLTMARLGGVPNRMFGCMEAFGWKEGAAGTPEGVGRGPTPEEWRQNLVQAIGTGIKGLTSWVYVEQAGGWQMYEPTRTEMAKVNKLIEHIEDDLLLGTPIDLAESDAGTVMTGVIHEENWPKERVWAGTVLCGPDTIVVTAANHIPAVRPEDPEIEPAEDVTITVQLPDYLRKVKAFEATEDGITPYDVEVQGGAAKLKLESIMSGRVFVLRRS